MTREELANHLISGATLTDIGQLDQRAREWLRRMVKSGAVWHGQSYAYPTMKRTYFWVAHPAA